jgi:trimeric autotransporter adhesin
LYFWRKTNNSLNTSYATYTTAGGVANSGGNSAIVPDGTIQVGQGFIVKTGASTTTLNFTNAMRTSSNTSPFLRNNEDRSRFWLNLTNTSGLFSQMLVAYMAEATSGIDNAIDGRYFNDAPVALTSLIGSEEYTIQGRALPFSTSDSVPLGFKTDSAGNYTIAIDHVDGLFSTGQSIYL